MGLCEMFDRIIISPAWICKRIHRAVEGILNRSFRGNQLLLDLAGGKRPQVRMRPCMAPEGNPGLTHFPDFCPFEKRAGFNPVRLARPVIRLPTIVSHKKDGGWKAEAMKNWKAVLVHIPETIIKRNGNQRVGRDSTPESISDRPEGNNTRVQFVKDSHLFGECTRWGREY